MWTQSVACGHVRRRHQQSTPRPAPRTERGSCPTRDIGNVRILQSWNEIQWPDPACPGRDAPLRDLQLAKTCILVRLPCIHAHDRWLAGGGRGYPWWRPMRPGSRAVRAGAPAAMRPRCLLDQDEPTSQNGPRHCPHCHRCGPTVRTGIFRWNYWAPGARLGRHLGGLEDRAKRSNARTKPHGHPVRSSW